MKGLIMKGFSFKRTIIVLTLCLSTQIFAGSTSDNTIALEKKNTNNSKQKIDKSAGCMACHQGESTPANDTAKKTS